MLLRQHETIEEFAIEFAGQRFSSSSITSGKVASLAHKARDNPMEDAAHEIQPLSRLALAMFSSTERPEILSRFGHHMRKELENDLASGFEQRLKWGKWM